MIVDLLHIMCVHAHIHEDDIHDDTEDAVRHKSRMTHFMCVFVM